MQYVLVQVKLKNVILFNSGQYFSGISIQIFSQI